jgi:pyrimidine-nucleoside phosphorylase
MNDTVRLIDEFARLRTEDAMTSLLVAARCHAFGVDEICRLASALAESGNKIAPRPGGYTADVASTGAPGSLSTLLCPLYLRAMGFVVPKLGVPGRPAGGIDVLAQLPGYKVHLNANDVHLALDKCGYAHFLANATFTPLDADLFRFRQKHAAQNVPALVVASLLAKKIACGIRFVGLDVRVAPHGNFGRNFQEARNAAALFCKTADAAGIPAVAILTDARTLYQPFLGRGESLLALRLLFESRAGEWLTEHADRCRLYAAHVSALAMPSDQRGIQGIADVFCENLGAQGSSMDAFVEKTQFIERASRRDVSAPREGFFSVNIPGLRSMFEEANTDGHGWAEFPDEVGVILRAKPGAYVQRGDVLAGVRASDVAWTKIGEPLRRAFQVSDLLDYAPGLEDIVRA